METYTDKASTEMAIGAAVMAKSCEMKSQLSNVHEKKLDEKMSTFTIATARNMLPKALGKVLPQLFGK
jgi:hypothetical protein